MTINKNRFNYQNSKQNSKVMRKLISKFDLFPALPTFRVKSEPEVSNVCGGVFSICVFAVFVYVFTSSVVSTVKLERITASEMT